MAEAEVTLTYRERPVAVAHALLLIFVPILALFVFLCFISVWLQTGAHYTNIALFLFSLLAILLATVGAVILTADKTIFLTRDGIAMPFVLCPGFHPRSHHAWSDLSAVRLLPGGQHGTFELKFKDGKKARIRLDLLPEKQLENMIVSMDVWCGGGDTFPALLEARVRLQEKRGDMQLLGYTEIWEEELTRRFGPTNFIPLEPGEKVRELTVERQLAFGGLSALYIVRDAGNTRLVLKEAVVPGDADHELRQTAETMLNREAEILASLSHPNITGILDNFLEGGRHYLLMELIKGEDLRQLVKENGPQPEKDVCRWTMQLAEALEYLHLQNPPVVHRDLSPDNLMLRESGDICIIDFGAANHFIGTATGTMIGKQAYIAPEQLRGKAEPASDIYAFGGTLFFLLTGKDPEALSVAHPKEVNASVSAEMDYLAAACTAQEPGERPSTAELKQRLQKIQKAAAHA